MAESQACLVSFDTDRIKEYIFATQDLKKIRGASALLERLNQDETLRIIQEVCPKIDVQSVIKGGGSAMTVVPTEGEAQKLIQAVERLYRLGTGSASITGAYLQVPTISLASGFGGSAKYLGALLRANKDRKGREPALPVAPYMRLCDACGRYPAGLVDPIGGEELLCRSCQIKQQESAKGRGLFWQQFHTVASGNQEWSRYKVPDDLGQIGSTSRPADYVGFIYGDGNGVGRVLESMDSFAEYGGFAGGLDSLIRETLYNALVRCLQGPRDEVAPFEIILVGGDDFMVVVPSDAALAIALEISREFEAHASVLPGTGGRRLSLAIGVVLAHSSFPIQAMHVLADELLNRAKRRSFELERDGKDRHGAMDFAVVTEAATSGLEVVRNEVLTERSFDFAPPDAEHFFLTERPYSAEGLERLLGHIREFKAKSFSRSALQAMYEGLFHSKMGAQLAAISILGRAKPELRTLALEFFRGFGVPSDGLPPWRLVKNEDDTIHHHTALGDLVELYPFVF